MDPTKNTEPNLKNKDELKEIIETSLLNKKDESQ